MVTNLNNYDFMNFLSKYPHDRMFVNFSAVIPDKYNAFLKKLATEDPISFEKFLDVVRHGFFKLDEVILGKTMPMSAFVVTALTHTLKSLNEVRRWYSYPIYISSFYRDPIHNKNVGGIDGSLHCFGYAFDIVAPKDSTRRLILMHLLRQRFEDVIYNANKNYIHCENNLSPDTKSLVISDINYYIEHGMYSM